MITFRVYDRPLGTVFSFKYLGRLPTATYDNWTAFIANIQKAKKNWSCLDWILKLEGADTHKIGHFYVVVIKAILLLVS